MKLYHSPGSCSLGIHVLLEEAGASYDLHKVDVRAGDQYKPEFTGVNPKSKVPTLERDDGSVLTEYPAIALWIAAKHPQAGLMPDGADALARAMETTDYCVATIHMHGFSRLFRPANYAQSEADHDAVKAKGMEMVQKGFGILDRKLGESGDYAAGSYSFADSAVFYISFWFAERLGQTLPSAVAAHYARMRARPAVQRTLAAEGLA